MKKITASIAIAIGAIPMAAMAFDLTLIINGNVRTYTADDVQLIGSHPDSMLIDVIGFSGKKNLSSYAVAPMITSTAFSIEENSTAPLMLEALDPNGDPVTYEITGGTDEALFEMVSADEFAFKIGANYEANTPADHIYDVELTVTDDGALNTSQNISVTVTDVDEGGGNNSNCGATPSNVRLNTSFDLDWDTDGLPNTFLDLDNTDIESIPDTTINEETTGRLVWAGVEASVNRTMWISECPGEPAIVPPGWVEGSSDANFYGNPCTDTGSSNRNVRWATEPLTGTDIYTKCGLDPDTSYYVNIQNNTCSSSSCDVWLGLTIN